MPTSSRSSAAVVVDCSALASFLLGEASLDEKVKAALEAAWAEGQVARAPQLLVWEFANVLNFGLRTGRLGHEEAAQAAGLFRVFPLELVPLDRDEAMDLASEAAERGLTAYDASYLLLAVKLDASLVTLDSQLARAAQEAGVEVVPAK